MAHLGTIFSSRPSPRDFSIAVPYRTDELIHLEGELPIVEDLMIHTLGEEYIATRQPD